MPHSPAQTDNKYRKIRCTLLWFTVPHADAPHVPAHSGPRVTTMKNHREDITIQEKKRTIAVAPFQDLVVSQKQALIVIRLLFVLIYVTN